ncbi:MAG TPA: cyclase family protein [Acidimicrobiales bacterium]|jgi:kynurenine formamidase|nr:cyclase family protein [Acidimicrobiales bacterium]
MVWSNIIDLSHEVYSGMPSLSGELAAFWENFSFDLLETWSGGRLSARSRIIHMGEHTGTHLDAPSHFDRNGRNVDQIPLSELIVPGHLLDLRHKKPHEAIGADDFEAAVRASGQALRPHTIVIAYTGQDVNWGTDGFFTERPYVTAEGALFLVDQGVTLFGTDLIGIDNPEEWWDPTHAAFLHHDVPMVQQLNNLEVLVDRAFHFAVLPLAMRGGTASPVRAIAMLES